MRVNNNETINPTQSRNMVERIYPARSSRTKKVTLVAEDNGGCSDKSGNVFVPAGETAYDRTVRLHEALHIDFTSKKFEPKDALDQGLEDARLHAHCSATKIMPSARRDEILTAIKDLRGAIRKSEVEITALTSLVILRAAAILKGEAKYTNLLRKAALKIAPEYLAQVEKAIALVKDGTDSENWQKARTTLQKYFAKDYKPEQPKQSNKSESKEQKQSKEESKEQSSSDSDELPGLSPFEDESEDSKDSKSDSDESDESEDSDESEESEDDSEDSEDSESDSDESEDSEDSESDSDESEDSEDSEDESEDSEDSEDESEDEDFSEPKKSEKSEDGSADGSPVDTDDMSGDEDGEDASAGQDSYDVIGVQEVKKPRKIKLHPDAYRGAAISKYDPNPERAAQLNTRYPKQLIIHRHDNRADSVPTLAGNKGKVSTLSGCRINAGRLAATASGNNVRVFNHRRGEGGGAILIDNSGSMSIPPATLIEFATKLPLATIAYYSAKNDSDSTKEGHLTVYAANGRRCNTPIEVYGGYGNLVDYQAINWLMEQPGPRWYVGDCNFTGMWQSHCDRFMRALQSKKLVTVVRTLAEMQKILQVKR